MTKESGWYRVKLNSEMFGDIASDWIGQIGYFYEISKNFHLVGSDCDFYEQDFDFIDWEHPINTQSDKLDELYRELANKTIELYDDNCDLNQEEINLIQQIKKLEVSDASN